MLIEVMLPPMRPSATALEASEMRQQAAETLADALLDVFAERESLDQLHLYTLTGPREPTRLLFSLDQRYVSQHCPGAKPTGLTANRNPSRNCLVFLINEAIAGLVCEWPEILSLDDIIEHRWPIDESTTEALYQALVPYARRHERYPLRVALSPPHIYCHGYHEAFHEVQLVRGGTRGAMTSQEARKTARKALLDQL